MNTKLLTCHNFKEYEYVLKNLILEENIMNVNEMHCVYSYDAISLGVLSLKKELEWSYIGFWGRDRSVQIQ
jgi:hypothetical protein